MATVNFRCYSDYFAGKIPSQAPLLDALEARSFETADRRILTTKSIGVPITIYLLILSESIDCLRNEQRELTESHQTIETLSTDDLLKRYLLSVKDATAFSNLQSIEWQRNTCWDVSQSTATSGCTVYDQTNVFVPVPSVANSLQDILSIDGAPMVSILKQVVRVDEKAPKQRPMIELFKAIFNSVEMYYAIDQRIQAELQTFNTMLSVDLARPSLGPAFDSHCQRRGSLIHSGNLGISMRHEDSTVCLGDTPIVESMERGLDEACDHVECVYNKMLYVCEALQ